ISAKMLEVARNKNKFDSVSYRQISMEDIDYPDESFDIILSSLALHYVKDLQDVFKNAARMLKPDGLFIFSAEHPVFTAEGSQSWHVDADGQIMHWPVDRYFDEGERSAVFLGSNVVKYHHTITTYINGLIDAGFIINRLVEPMPPENMLDDDGMKNELRRPMMILFSAKKQ
ncbi:class I SAM-dependent methyltransferase, partial [Tyzzerella sp. OttesenSCG-928-J15]|nr:class I SAM-dependent methyltransferase [Tyzzerella sp. OttesenSCG-928-J15]